MITRDICRHYLKERRKVEKMMQMEFSLCIGLFGLICSDRKPTELRLVGFRFRPSHKPKRSSIEPNFQNGLVWSVYQTVLSPILD